MLEIIFEFIFELFIQIILEFVFQIALELGIESIRNVLNKDKKANPIFAYMGIILIGIIIGIISKLLFPNQIIKILPIKGLSLIITPIVSGLLMYIFGNWRKNNGHNITKFATFWGGALFAFSIALTRFLFISLF